MKQYPSTEELVAQAQELRERLRETVRNMNAARSAARQELAATYETIRKAREQQAKVGAVRRS
jgi:predicted  nucleic acid-binding Zn-ribbon protein